MVWENELLYHFHHVVYILCSVANLPALCLPPHPTVPLVKPGPGEHPGLNTLVFFTCSNKPNVIS